MRFTPLLSTLLVTLVARADFLAGTPYPAPAGFEQWISPTVQPPLVNGAGDWAQAVAKARKFVSQLTLEEKVNITYVFQLLMTLYYVAHCYLGLVSG